MVGKSELRVQRYLILGIVFGAAFGFAGSLLANALFRLIDILSATTTVEKELYYVVVALFAFFSLLFVVYMIAREIDKKSK